MLLHHISASAAWIWPGLIACSLGEIPAWSQLSVCTDSSQGYLSERRGEFLGRGCNPCSRSTGRDVPSAQVQSHTARTGTAQHPAPGRIAAPRDRPGPGHTANYTCPHKQQGRGREHEQRPPLSHTSSAPGDFSHIFTCITGTQDGLS